MSRTLALFVLQHHTTSFTITITIQNMPRLLILEGTWPKNIVIIGMVVTMVGSMHLDCKSNPCMYGICVDDPNSQSYRCYCIDGYTGINCEINWDECWSNPCLNGGTCNDAIASYNCTCSDGFVGVNCEQKYSECMNEPCQNNGTCLDTNGVSCECLEGFSGEFCEHDAVVCNATSCQNQGECVEGPGVSFSCRCAEGWSGEFCERDVNECADNSSCRNGGLCINLPGGYQCACLFGFSGKRCDKEIMACLDDPCENSAVCLSEDGQPVCYCVPDYHGAFCELRYDDCESKYARCENGGQCVDGVNDFSCACPPAYAGDNCATLLQQTSPKPAFESRTERPEPTATSAEHEPADETSPSFLASESLDDLKPLPGDTSGDPTASTIGSATDSPTDSATDSATAAGTRAGTTPGTTPGTSAGTTDGPTSSELQRPTDADYQETISSNLTDDATTPPALTMLPSAILSTTTTLASSSDLFPLYSDSSPTEPSTLDATTIAANIADDHFTSVTDFHRTTFGTDIQQNSRASTTDYHGLTVHTCTADQCANTTRCTYNDTQCDCSYPDNCRMHSSVSNAAFNGQSYVRQKFSIDSGMLSIFVRLKTKAKSAILIHALFDDERYVLLYMETGQLKFQFSCGLQTMLFGELDSSVNNGYEVDLEMRFKHIVEQVSDRCSAQLLVNGTVAMSGEQVLQTHETIPLVARLHLGGIPVAFSHQFPQIVLGFVGCMSLLKVNGVKRDFISDSIEAVQIEECRSFLCLSNPCKNFGACEEIDAAIKCKCIAGYSGETCESSICDDNPCHLGATCLISPGVNFICVCPLGTHGLFCEQDTTIVQPSFSVFAPGFSSYVAYGISTSLKDNMELKMRIIPQHLEQISLIAYMGQSGAKHGSSDHFSLTYVRGYVMLTWDLGSGIGRRGRDSWLYVEDVGNVTGRAAGLNTRLDVSPILYIGGHKTKYFESLPHDLPLHTGFSGCIYDVELRTDDNVFPITLSSPATGRGVGQCHRNECSHHSCKNGAVCLSYGPTYSCICMKDWQGPDCSNRVNCTSSNPLCL